MLIAARKVVSFGRHAPQSVIVIVVVVVVYHNAVCLLVPVDLDSVDQHLKSGTCMPITGSYVKEGTYRRGVAQALSANNPTAGNTLSLQVHRCSRPSSVGGGGGGGGRGCLRRSLEKCVAREEGGRGFWCLFVCFIHS